MLEQEFDVLEKWALAAVAGELARAPEIALGWLATLSLSPDERDTLLLLYVRERSAPVRRALAQQSGEASGQVNRFLIERWFGRDVLGVSSALQRQALVVLGGREGEAFPFWLRLSEVARERLDERAPEMWLWPFGSRYIGASAAPSDGSETTIPKSIVQLAKEILVTENAMWTTLDGLSKEQTTLLAHELSTRAARAVVVIDFDLLSLRGVAKAAWLRALRIEADRSDWCLLVTGSGRRAEAAQFLIAEDFINKSVRVIFSGLFLGAEWARADMPVHIGQKAAVSAAAALPAGIHQNELDDAKRKAAQDAQRALELFGRPSQAPLPAVNAAAPRTAPVPVRQERAIRPAPAAPVARPSAPQVEMDSREAEQFFPRSSPAEEAETPAPVPVRRERPAPRPAVKEAPTEEGVDTDALAATAMSSNDPNERIACIQKLSGQRSPRVIAALRANVQSGHDGVRGAAEAGMAALFGPDWNRTRAIARPVQPPRSDDDGGIPGL